MAAAAAGVLQFLTTTCWTLFSSVPQRQIASDFLLVFTSQFVLEQILGDSLIRLAPGLLEALQSPTPPSLAFFKNLPTNGYQLWGVYIIVLEKFGFRPKIYVGSSTELAYGVQKRLRTYDTGVNLPRYVKLALDQGYTITHKGLLCTAPIPEWSITYKIRALLLLLEAFFAITLWAMVSRIKDYKLPGLCPWDLDSFEYDGCCSHLPLNEKISGMPDNPNKLTGTERQAASSKNLRENNLAARRWACEPCGVNFGARNQLQHHCTLKKHKDKVAGITKALKCPRAKERNVENLASRRYYCRICNYVASTQQKLTAHLSRKKHINNAKANSI